jgi:HAD superfamily hydrolase (TIGR01509 family)
MPAILFGSISTVADTSELQREAYNRAFAEHGLDWRWDRDDYRTLLTSNGGRNRVADQAAKSGQQVDADAVHETKSRIFQQSLAGAGLRPRPGVAETVREAHARGLKVGLVTTTADANVQALLDALGPELGRDDFDLVIDSSEVDRPKPDPAAYETALRILGEQPGDCVAVEDNVGGVKAAVDAGVACVAFPNENTAGHDFSGAAARVDRIDLDDLQKRIADR